MTTNEFRTTTVSRELQRFDLELWRGDSVASVTSAASSSSSSSSSSTSVDYVHSPAGLFPLACARNMKAGPLAKQRSKFRFLGKFMAKAIMDSRMVRPFCFWCSFLSSRTMFGLGGSDRITVDLILEAFHYS